jgi:hypothetical protein
VTHGLVNPVLRGEMTARLHAYSVGQFCICRCVFYEMVFLQEVYFIYMHTQRLEITNTASTT